LEALGDGAWGGGENGEERRKERGEKEEVVRDCVIGGVTMKSVAAHLLKGGIYNDVR